MVQNIFMVQDLIPYPSCDENWFTETNVMSGKLSSSNFNYTFIYQNMSRVLIYLAFNNVDRFWPAVMRIISAQQ